jgi:toxin HigB-1
MAIQSFAGMATEIFFLAGKVDRKAGWASISRVVRRKLDMLHYATKLIDLKVPPGNRLEELKGSLAGRHSIRINDQWRIVFRWTDAGPTRWTDAGPTEVCIADYH